MTKAKFMMIIKKTINIIFVIFITVYILIFALNVTITKKGMLLPVGLINVVSGSMQPEIFAGDTIFIKKVSTDKLKKGNVISYYFKDKIVTHKINQITDGYVFVQAQNSDSLNEKVKMQNIIGVYTGLKINNFYSFINFTRSVYGFLILIILPSSYLFIYEVTKLTDNLKNIRKEK